MVYQDDHGRIYKAPRLLLSSLAEFAESVFDVSMTGEDDDPWQVVITEMQGMAQQIKPRFAFVARALCR